MFDLLTNLRVLGGISDPDTNKNTNAFLLFIGQLLLSLN